VLRDLLRKAQSAAERHLPESVREAGRKLAEQVQGRAPEPVRRLVDALRGGEDAPPPLESSAPTHAEPLVETGAAVVLFAYPDDEAADRLAALLTSEGVAFRRMNLHEQPQAARQIATLTGVMAPPYVYIRGRFWGGEGEISSLAALGELGHVISGDLARLSDEARRIGKLHQDFDEAITADNIAARLRLGHILSVDELDCWYERGPDGDRLYYEGAPRPPAELRAVAEEIEARFVAADGQLRVEWRFEPAVSI